MRLRFCCSDDVVFCRWFIFQFLNNFFQDKLLSLTIEAGWVPQWFVQLKQKWLLSSFIILLAVQLVVRCGYWSWRKFHSSAFFGLFVDMSSLISCFESFRCHCFLYSEIWGVLVGTTLEVCFNQCNLLGFPFELN